MRRLVTVFLAALAGLVLAGPAAAATGTLFGGATLNPDGSVTLVSDLSDAATQNDFSGIDFEVDLPFEGLKRLSTQYNVTDDDCRGGSPRFQLNVDGKNVFVYLGPAPSFSGCEQGTWLASGNLVGNNDACRWDTSQLAAGTQCNTYDGARTLLAGKTITGIQLVADAGWAFEDKEQTVIVRGIRVNGRHLFGHLNPARACMAQRAAMGAAAFRDHYGTNRNKANAFGKCVAAMAKAQRSGTAASVQTSTIAAAKTCRAARATRQGGVRTLALCISARVKADQSASASTTTSKGKGRAPGRP